MNDLTRPNPNVPTPASLHVLEAFNKIPNPEMGQVARIVQIDFSAAFDRVNHLGILFKLCSVGIGGSVLSVLTVSL